MTAAPFETVLLGNLVLPDRVLEQGFLAIEGGRIAAIGQGEAPAARTVHDHRGRYVFPGLVDGHMHTSSAFGWRPGIIDATRSAAAGGVTTCVDMPYDVPDPVITVGHLRDKIAILHEDSHVDLALYGTIAKQGGADQIEALAAEGISAFKLSTYEYDSYRFPRIEPLDMLAALKVIAGTGLPVAIHQENQEMVERLIRELRAEGRTTGADHARSRPPIVEQMANLEIFELGREAGAHVHIAHSSIARGFDMAAWYREGGAKATGEACIQYLCLTEHDLDRLGAFAKCNPAVRTPDEVERMWDRIARGMVEYVSTDHAPWPKSRKEGPDIFAAGAGLTGLQSFAPLMFTLVSGRGLPLPLMAAMTAEKPARFHGIYPRKGVIAVGSDADFCVLEPGDFPFDEATIVDRPELRWSPYHGRAMKARVAAAMLRGQPIWDGSTVLAKPGQGRFVKRG